MVKVVDRERYNTTNSDKVAHFVSSLSVLDFGWYAEVLYKTKEGSYFLKGQGNAGSPYANRKGDRRSPGACTKSLTITEVHQWFEKRK